MSVGLGRFFRRRKENEAPRTAESTSGGGAGSSALSAPTKGEKSKPWRFVLGFFCLIALAYGLMWGIYFFQKWRATRDVEAFAARMEQFEEEERARMMADTYGGTTPQETLRLYIEAVEKGDYELASKYLIEDARPDEVEELKLLQTKNNLKQYLTILKAMREEGPVNETFRMISNFSGGTYIARFLKYPNGIWKIVEI